MAHIHFKIPNENHSKYKKNCDARGLKMKFLLIERINQFNKECEDENKRVDQRRKDVQTHNQN